MRELFKAKIYKFTELDNYQNGVYGETTDHGLVHTISSEYLSTLIGQIKNFFGTYSDNDFELFETQINFSRHENEEGIDPYDSETQLFKKNELDLYLASYSIYIERHIILDFSEYETEMVFNKIKKGGEK